MRWSRCERSEPRDHPRAPWVPSLDRALSDPLPTVPRMPWTYMLRCSDRSYYVGSTWRLEHRLDQHQSGNGAEYTKRRRPVELVYAAEFERVEDAYAWEKRLQGWGRAKREALIRGDFDALPGLSARRAGRARVDRRDSP